jgi:hypothetical protein
MAFQSVVNEDMAAGIPGEMATTRPRYAYACIAGEDVTLGTIAYVDAEGKAYGSAGDGRTAKGIFVSPHQHVQIALASDVASLVVKTGCEVGVLERGECFVKATGTVTAGATFNAALAGSIYLKSGVANDIVPVRVG